MTKHGYHRPWGQHWWSANEDDLLWQLFLDGNTNGESALEMNMSKGAVATRLYRLKRLRRAQLPVRNVVSFHENHRASQEMLDERERRREASYRRDIGSELMGDPPVGYSALDQRKSR